MFFILFCSDYLGLSANVKKVLISNNLAQWPRLVKFLRPNFIIGQSVIPHFSSVTYQRNCYFENQVQSHDGVRRVIALFSFFQIQFGWQVFILRRFRADVDGSTGARDSGAGHCKPCRN